MATNQVYEDGVQFAVPAAQVDDPATPTSGDPVRIGNLPAVALTDAETDADGTSVITVKTNGVYEFAVEAESGAIGYGDLLYYDAADDGLNNTAAGNTRFGYALGTVVNLATGIISVKIGY